MAEKTLRQIICETIHPEYKQKIKGCYECGEAERIADSILVSISARIKAKALTDEQIKRTPHKARAIIQGEMGNL